MCGVVSTKTSTGFTHDRCRFAARQPQIPGTKTNFNVFAQRPLTIADGIDDNFCHSQITFDTGNRLGVFDRITVATHQICQYKLFDTCLAKRWQNSFDVTQEHTVRTNHQNALIFKRKSKCVEQVSRTMQRDNCFARARPTFNNQHTLLR